MLREMLHQAIRNMAGSPSHARGVKYFEDGRVSLESAEEGVRATVRGTNDYDVQLWVEDDELQYECSCPVGMDGEFCKHCVATTLAWLAASGGDTLVGKKTGRPKSGRARATGKAVRPGESAIRAQVASLGPAALADLLVEASLHDERLRELLALKAGDGTDTKTLANAWKRALTQATSPQRFVDWRGMHAFASAIAELLDRLEYWIREGRAGAVVDMAEHAAERVESAIEHCDDSGGEIGVLMDRVRTLHLAACQAAQPAPVPLAQRLLKHELTSEWDTFTNIAEHYANVLGEQGLAAYRALAEAEWAKVPALGPSDGDEKVWQGWRFRITRVMESIARQSGDLDALIGVLSRDLPSAWHFLQIAELCQGRDRLDEALEWAERGLAAFPDETDERLLEFLIDDYLRRGRGDEAMTLAWREYDDSPELETYRKLHRVAKSLDTWPSWREKALSHLRDAISREFAERSRSRYARQSAPDQSRMVEILLWEKRTEAAWQAAGSGVCREDLWLALADQRAGDHPADSLAIYGRQLMQCVAQTSNRGYAQAIALLEKIRPLHIATHGQQGFDRYVVELRAATKAKRNFIKLLGAMLQRVRCDD